ncbi:hypothetical protein N8Z24_00580 [bacterium]|nr:hypothetical protein [bacterium]
MKRPNCGIGSEGIASEIGIMTRGESWIVNKFELKLRLMDRFFATQDEVELAFKCAIQQGDIAIQGDKDELVILLD